jgi:hypothetical protein
MPNVAQLFDAKHQKSLFLESHVEVGRTMGTQQLISSKEEENEHRDTGRARE